MIVHHYLCYYSSKLHICTHSTPIKAKYITNCCCKIMFWFFFFFTSKYFAPTSPFAVSKLRDIMSKLKLRVTNVMLEYVIPAKYLLHSRGNIEDIANIWSVFSGPFLRMDIIISTTFCLTKALNKFKLPGTSLAFCAQHETLNLNFNLIHPLSFLSQLISEIVAMCFMK